MKGYHETRFAHDPKRDVLWKTLCEAWLQRFVGAGACVLELGCGYGHFINHIRGSRRIALDSWQGAAEFLAPGVESVCANATDLSAVEDDSVDFAFASNLFEHLAQDEFRSVLSQLRRKLRKGGTLGIIQPNYRFAYREYFDDYTHVAIYSDRSLCDFLAANGFRVLECHPRVLPFSVASRLPVWPALIRLYLKLPFRPMGKQMWVWAAVDERDDDRSAGR